MVPFVAKALRLTKALALNRESALEDTKMTSMILFPISTTYPTAIEISEFGELFWTNPLTNLPDRYNRINILYRRCLQKMTDKELLAKARLRKVRNAQAQVSGRQRVRLDDSRSPHLSSRRGQASRGYVQRSLRKTLPISAVQADGRVY